MTRTLIETSIMLAHEANGEAVLLGHIGIFNRPVYRYDGKVWRQYIRFDRALDEYVPGEFYDISPGMAEQVINLLQEKL